MKREKEQEFGKIFSVKDRSVFTRELTGDGDHAITGVRKGFHYILRYDKAKPKESCVTWGALVNGEWRYGASGMISDAMAAIEQKVANRDWDARMGTL